MKEKLYIAGPEVFLPNMEKVRDTKLEICALYKFSGVFPIDSNPLPELPRKKFGHYICRANKQKIQICNGVIANITPFRSVSADVGTTYEIGYADGLRRPVFAYTNNPDLFVSRNLWQHNGHNEGDKCVDEKGVLIEDFDMADNLMIDTAILDSSNTLIISKFHRELDDLTLFEEAVSAARKYFDELEKYAIL